MFKLFAAVLCCVALSMAYALPKDPVSRKVCTFPNGTDTAIHVFNCDGDALPILVNSAKILDQQGNLVYPINPKVPIIIDLEVVNNGIQYDDNRVDVKILEYSENWLTGQCDWTEIPTFGLLDNIDGCSYAHNCPLKTGPLSLRLPIDLSGFSAIINIIAGHNPYAIVVRMLDYNAGDDKHEEFS
uniref:ML domain-containing protein n=1 Tax=Rhabditophanes sp. KR3021 TaxID=114890 RepID=A0AC35UCA0_9BILA